ncbi:MAG: FliH/SctL family protein [Armatimonadota bacterium]
MTSVIKYDKNSCVLAGPVKLQHLDIPEPQPGEKIDPVADAIREADAIVCRAQAEAESIREEAQAQGYKIGLSEGNERFQNLMERLESDIQALVEDRQAILGAIEPDVLKLCVASVEKIVRHEIKTDPKVVLRVIKSCLRRLRDTSDVRIRVSVAELEEVRAKRDELLSLADGLKSISIIDDRRVSPGGCVIETSSGDFDATVENQLDRINKKLGETYEDGRGQCPGSD